MMQWLGVWSSTAGGISLIPSQGTKILHATERSMAKKEKYKKSSFFLMQINGNAFSFQNHRQQTSPIKAIMQECLLTLSL